MNILLCVTGFFVCFSSFGMNNGFKIRDDQASRIVNLMNEKKFTEASNSLKQHLLDKTLDFNAVLKNCKQAHTLLSYYIYFVKDKMYLIKPGDEYCVGHLGYLLLSGSKNQLDEGQYRPDYYLQKNDKRIREMIISLVANKRFNLVEVFLDKGSDICCLDYNETFKYNLGDGQKEYTFCSLYISVLKYEMERISYCYISFVVPSILSNSYLSQLTGEQYKKDCYIKVNDPRLIDIGLYAIDREFLKLADRFFKSCDAGYLRVCDTVKCEDISHAIFSFYYMCFVENDEQLEFYWQREFRGRARVTLCETISNDLSTYKAKMLEMISYLEEKKYHRLARLFLKEYFSKEGLRQEVIEHNILSCYQYVLNQMEIMKTKNMGAVGGLQPIAKPKVGLADLKDIMIFLEGNKYHSITNALFSVYGRNKVLDANVVFMYMGFGEKVCTPVALSVFYALKELEDGKKEEDKLSKLQWENRKNFLAKSARRMEDNYLLNQCIANTQGSRQQSLVSLKVNIKKYALVYGYCEHLYNEIMQYGEQYRKHLKQQIHNEDVTCVEIMKWMLYYQAQ